MNFYSQTISAEAHTNIEHDLSARFFKQLGGSDFTFQTFHDTSAKDKDRTLTRIFTSSPTDERLRLWHAHSPVGVYVTVNETDGKGRKIENVVRVRAVWQEDDDGYTGEFPLTPSMVVETSPGHHHRYWLVSDDWPADEIGKADFDNVMRRMVESYGSDKNAKDITRVLRVPGYLNRKHGAHMVRIAAVSGKKYTRAEICAAFPPVEKREKAAVPFTPALETDANRVRDALQHINADDRDIWMRIGMALKAELGDAGRSLWDEWSRSSEKYDERGQDTAWQSFKRDDGVTMGTLLHEAKQGGWKDDNYNGYFVDLPKTEQQSKANSDATFVPSDIDKTEDEIAPAGSEESLALHFANRHDDELRYVAPWSRWMLWNGTYWEFDETLKAFNLARSLCRDAANQSNKKGAAIASAKTIRAVEGLSKADRRLAATVDQWDADPWLLNTPGGVIDLRDGMTRPHRHDYYMSKITMVAANRSLPSLWIAFLNKVTGGNAELVAFLQRVAGYSLTGDTREHALFFLYGVGANGKTTFLNAITAAFGDYCRNAPIETFTANKIDRHPTDLAGLRGARLVTAVETEEGRQWAESKIKALTGGDKISARFMRQDFFEYTPQFKLLIAGNHKPGLRSVDEAIRRRMHLIPFTVTIPPEERDKDLKAKLAAESAGILQWMIDGCLAWQRLGLAPPAIVTEATAAYLEAQDAMAAWIDECCVVEPLHWESSANLFASWSVWATRSGEFVGSQKRFLDRLENLPGMEPWRSNNVRGFRGLRFRAPDYDGPR